MFSKGNVKAKELKDLTAELFQIKVHFRYLPFRKRKAQWIFSQNFLRVKK